MGEIKKLELNLIDIYQLLISDCRYGYSRNNHLMPKCAYDRVKEIIPKMYEVDDLYAIHTLRQICEECIKYQLTYNFFYGEDDEYENREEAMEFVKWCLDWIHERTLDKLWAPYNYDNYLRQLAFDEEKHFIIIDDDTKEILIDEEHMLNKKEVIDYIFKEYVGKEVSYTRTREKNPETGYMDYIYHLSLYSLEQKSLEQKNYRIIRKDIKDNE